MLRYDLGSGDRVLSLPYVTVDKGRWHSVVIERYGTNGILRLDRGEGKYYAELGFVDQHRWLAFAGSNIFAAADVKYNEYSGEAYVNGDLVNSEC